MEEIERLIQEEKELNEYLQKKLELAEERLSNRRLVKKIENTDKNNWDDNCRIWTYTINVPNNTVYPTTIYSNC